MAEENNLQETYTPSVFKMLFSRWRIILIVSLILMLVGTALSVYKNKTTYVASKSLMLITRMEDSGIGTNGVDMDNAVTDDIIEDIFAQIKSTKYASMVNQEYQLTGDKKVSSGSVSVKSGTEGSFIFTLSYRAEDAKTATEKLEYIIDFADELCYEKQSSLGQPVIKENFFEYHSVADKIVIKPVQYDADVKETNSLSRNIAITVILSLVVGFAVALVVGALDTRLVDKDELEAITGASLLTFIEDSDVEHGKSKKKGKKKN